MRWIKKYKRYVKRFAMLPIKIRDETRWLETVYLEQKYDAWKFPFPGWINCDFVSEGLYKEFGDISIWDQVCEFFKRFRKGEKK